MKDLLFAMQQKNLVYNYNFIYFSNRTGNTPIIYNHPDGWVYTDIGSGGQIGFDHVSNSCRIKKSNDNQTMSFSQNISEFPRWKESLLQQKVTAIAKITNPGSTSFTLNFSLYDGMETSAKKLVFKAGETHEINIELIVHNDATILNILFECNSANAIIYLHKVYANIGSIAISTLPCIVEGVIGERKQYLSTSIPPIQELSLCESSKELAPTYTRLSSFLNGKFGKGPNKLSILPDMRGYFSRAWDNGAKIDPDASKRTKLGQGSVIGDHVGTVEGDQFKEHDHELKFSINGKIPAGPLATMTIINPFLNSKTEKVGGEETRSKNIAELYTMKWA